jgi:uncharacterized protein (DUF488 family)
MEVLTLGHSTRSLEELHALCVAHDIQRVADIRQYPASRRHPHFAREPLARFLEEHGLEYVWLQSLGGRRPRRADSPHTAWKEEAFAGYADHMETPEFRSGIDALLERAGERRTAVLCAEAWPYGCHRRLVSDWLVAHGTEVRHVLALDRLEPHRMTDFARRDGDHLVYDGGQQGLWGR